MPVFLFGIEKEAEIYCISSKRGLAVDPQAKGIIAQIRQILINQGKVSLPLKDITDYIVDLCRQNVFNQIDDYEDEKGVAWTIALLSRAYISAGYTSYTYDTLFNKCFIGYYSGDC